MTVRMEISEPMFTRKKRVLQPTPDPTDDFEYAVIGKNDKFSNSILYKVRKYINKIQNTPTPIAVPKEPPQNDLKSEDSTKINEEPENRVEETNNQPEKPVEETKHSSKKPKQKNDKLKNGKPSPKSTTIQKNSAPPPHVPKIQLSWFKSEYQRAFQPWTISPPVSKPAPTEPKSWLKKYFTKKVDKVPEVKAPAERITEYQSNYKTPCTSVQNSVENPDWYDQILELRALANKYEERGRGMHFSRDHFMQLISSKAKMWDLQAPKDSAVVNPPHSQLESVKTSPKKNNVNVGTPENSQPPANVKIEPTEFSKTKNANVGAAEIAKTSKNINIGTAEFSKTKNVNVSPTDFSKTRNANVGTTEYSNTFKNVNMDSTQPYKNVKIGTKKFPLSTKFSVSVQTGNQESTKTKKNVSKKSSSLKQKVKFKDSGILARTFKKPTLKTKKLYMVENIPEENLFGKTNHIKADEAFNDHLIEFSGNIRPKISRNSEKKTFDSILERAMKRNNFWAEF